MPFFVVIDFAIRENGLEAIVRCGYPTVYLDHWAWLEFSSCQALAARFANALKKRNGTVAISWLNLVEFCRMKDERHGPEADGLLDSILPNVFFLDSDFGKVISREDILLAGVASLPPHADLGLYEHFVGTNLLSPTSLSLLTAHDLFRFAQASGLAERCDAVADSVVGQIAALREEYTKDQGFRAAVTRLPPKVRIQRGTRIILREMLRSILLNPRMTVEGSDVIDIGHAVVPVAYCDYVLLDNDWRTQVEKARGRIATAGMTFPVAKVFSANSIEDFLRELES